MKKTKIITFLTVLTFAVLLILTSCSGSSSLPGLLRGEEIKPVKNFLDIDPSNNRTGG